VLLPERGRLATVLGRPDLFRGWLASRLEDVAGWPRRPDVNPLSIWLREAAGADDVIIGGSNAFSGPWNVALPDWAITFRARTRAGRESSDAISGAEALRVLEEVLDSA
jgi:hypothetical protein